MFSASSSLKSMQDVLVRVKAFNIDLNVYTALMIDEVQLFFSLKVFLAECHFCLTSPAPLMYTPSSLCGPLPINLPAMCQTRRGNLHDQNHLPHPYQDASCPKGNARLGRPCDAVSTFSCPGCHSCDGHLVLDGH
nr:hypothetical protein BgiMline_007872 [Biomphalaria glabrata]